MNINFIVLFFLLNIYLCGRTEREYDSDTEHLFQLILNSKKFKTPKELKMKTAGKIKFMKKMTKKKLKNGLLSVKQKLEDKKELLVKEDDDDEILLEDQIRLPAFIKGTVRDIGFKGDYYEKGDTYGDPDTELDEDEKDV